MNIFLSTSFNICFVCSKESSHAQLGCWVEHETSWIASDPELTALLIINRSQDYPFNLLLTVPGGPATIYSMAKWQVMHDVHLSVHESGLIFFFCSKLFDVSVDMTNVCLCWYPPEGYSLKHCPFEHFSFLCLLVSSELFSILPPIVAYIVCIAA